MKNKKRGPSNINERTESLSNFLSMQLQLTIYWGSTWQNKAQRKSKEKSTLIYYYYYKEYELLDSPEN